MSRTSEVDLGFPSECNFIKAERQSSSLLCDFTSLFNHLRLVLAERSQNLFFGRPASFDVDVKGALSCPPEVITITSSHFSF